MLARRAAFHCRRRKPPDSGETICQARRATQAIHGRLGKVSPSGLGHEPLAKCQALLAQAIQLYSLIQITTFGLAPNVTIGLVC